MAYKRYSFKAICAAAYERVVAVIRCIDELESEFRLGLWMALFPWRRHA